MPSRSLQEWRTKRTNELDEIETAHTAIGGSGRGRRYATQQVNHAYVVLLSSQFQGFCRDLHSECVGHLLQIIQPASLQAVLSAEFLLHRTLDRGNPTPGNLGADFNRLGLEFWIEVNQIRRINERRQKYLEELNDWRNAIAHHDFDPAKLGGRRTLTLERIRRFRSVCNALATDFDRVMARHLETITGSNPW